jgi:hypothetical protein
VLERICRLGPSPRRSRSGLLPPDSVSMIAKDRRHRVGPFNHQNPVTPPLLHQPSLRHDSRTPEHTTPDNTILALTDTHITYHRQHAPHIQHAPVSRAHGRHTDSDCWASLTLSRRRRSRTHRPRLPPPRVAGSSARPTLVRDPCCAPHTI